MLKLKRLLLFACLTFLSGMANAQIPSDTVCLGDTSIVRYFVSNAEAGVQYTWALDAGGTIMDQTNDTLFVKWGQVEGLYKVSVNSLNAAGCAGQEASYWILIQPGPSLNVKPEVANVCNGIPVTVRASGADSYSWSPAEGLSATDSDTAAVAPEINTVYTVSGSSGGCVATKTVTVTVGERPEAGFTYEQTGNYVLQLTNTSEGATAFHWDFGNGTSSSEENPIVEYSSDNDYLITLIVENTCGKDTLKQTAEVIKLGFSDITGTQIHLGPNPVSENAFLRLKMNRPETIHMKLFDSLGRLLQESSHAGKPELLLSVEMEQYEKGLYFLHVLQGKEFVNLKLIKQ